MPQKESTILIIDDEQSVIEQLTRHFRRRNCVPIATADPTIVEQTLKAFEVQLILLDLRMERLDGYGVLKNLRDNGIHIPVIIITAYLEDERERLKQFGITDGDVIQKPFGDFTKAEAIINRKLNRIIFPEEVGSEYEARIYIRNKAKILIVDDEEEIAEILGETLKGNRYGVIIFTDGKKALDYFNGHYNDIHMGIIDMGIPGIPGHKLIQEMLKLNPKLKIVPISAKFADEMKADLKSVGFDPEQLVTKPFKLEVLIEQLKVHAASEGLL